MGDLEHVGTLDISGGAVRIRIYAPISKKLEWYTSVGEQIEKEYSPLNVRAKKAWVVYGKEMSAVNGIIRGNLEISLEDIPESAEIAVINGEYDNTSTGVEPVGYNGLGNAKINSTFMKKSGVERLKIPQKPVAPRVVPQMATTVVAKPKPIDPHEEHLANQRKITFWERTKAAVSNRPSNK